MLRFPDEEPPAFAPTRRRSKRSALQVPIVAAADDVVMCAGMNGATPGIFAATSRQLFVISMPDGETRISTLHISDILAVEEDVQGHYADVVVLTGQSLLVLTHVPRARSWEFCRRVRQAILGRPAPPR